MRTVLKILTFVVLGLTVWTFAASAQVVPELTAGKVASFCKHAGTTIGELDRTSVEDGLCLGMVEGWREVFYSFSVTTPDGKKRLRISGSLTTGHQLTRIFCNYVVARPESENERPLLVFVWALQASGVLTEEALR